MALAVTETLVRWAQDHGAARGDQTAYAFLADGQRQSAHLTYRQLDQQARQIAGRLLDQGLQGKPLLLLLGPDLDFVIALLGALYAGAIAVPWYPPSLDRNRDHLAAVLAAADAGALLTMKETARQLARWDDLAPWLQTIPQLVMDDLLTQPGESPDGQDLPTIAPEQTALVQFTSGTVTQPKGVPLTHRHLLANLTVTARNLGFEPGDHGHVGVSWLPPYHQMGLVGGILLNILMGGEGILMPPAAFLRRPLSWLEAISEHRAIYSPAPNFAFDLAVERTTPEQRAALDLSCWRWAMTGSEPVRAQTLERFAQAFGVSGFQAAAFQPGYGQAESTLVISMGRHTSLPITREVDGEALAAGRIADPLPTRPTRTLVGCGRALAGHRILIVDPQSRQPCAPEQVGEIWVAGPSVAQGYWVTTQMADAPFGASLAGEPEAGFFLRTGDLGFVENGQLFVTGRIKDLIVIRGRNLYPQDIEAAVEASHPALQPHGAAAFGVEEPDGEALWMVAEVRLEFRHRPPEDLFPAMRAAVARTFQVELSACGLLRPGHLPRAASGKISRLHCREALQCDGLSLLAWHQIHPVSQEEKSVSAMGNSRLHRQMALAARLKLGEVLGVDPATLDLDQSIQAMGLGSLQAAALRYELEETFDIRVPDALYQEEASVADFLRRLVVWVEEANSERGSKQ